MKAVILAGGSGTRLYPLTISTNKHLLSLYNKPVIYYAVEKLVNAGISKIMIITSPSTIYEFVNLLGSGKNFISPKTDKQVQIVYGIQNEPNGVAYGLHLAKDYIGDDNVILLLGDNIFEDNIGEHVKNFKSGATVFLKKVTDPKRFGVAELNKKGKITKIIEKPKKPKTNFAVTGLYMYDNSVFGKMIDQKKSERGEYEITDINNIFIKEGTLNHIVLKKNWFDIGSFDSLLDASIFMRKKNGKK